MQQYLRDVSLGMAAVGAFHIVGEFVDLELSWIVGVALIATAFMVLVIAAVLTKRAE